MSFKKIFIPAVLIAAICLFISCEEQGNDPVIIEIVCIGSSFNGFYLVNKNPDVNTFDPIESEGNEIYSFRKKLHEIDKVIITAIRDSTDATLFIYIYRDDEIVISKSQAADYINYTYEYGEEETSSASE